MSDAPPSVELMDLARELRRKYSEVELKQLGVLLGVKATKRKYEEKLAGLERELCEARRSVSVHSDWRVKAELALKQLQEEQLVDRLVPGLVTAWPSVEIGEVIDRARGLALQITAAREERLACVAAMLPGPKTLAEPRRGRRGGVAMTQYAKKTTVNKQGVMKSIPLRQWEAAAYAASGETFQLRRVVKVPATAKKNSGYEVEIERGGDFETALAVHMPDTSQKIIKAPYGAPGDKLALREAWGMSYIDLCRERPHTEGGYWGSPSAPNRKQCVVYKADSAKMPDDSPNETARWCPPTTMPLWAVRWHPVITAVRLERVQDITEADARACGAEWRAGDGFSFGWRFDGANGYVHEYATDAYKEQFDRDNPRTPWKDNPWTWVYDVEGLKALTLPAAESCGEVSP